MTDAAELIRDARMHQAAMVEHRNTAGEHQDARDRLLHELRESDPERWSYAQIAKATGLTVANVVKILRRPATHS